MIAVPPETMQALLDSLGVAQEKRWVDEKYAVPVNRDLMERFYRDELSEVVSDYVVDQISSFRSWRDAFLELARADKIGFKP
ncbi:MAG: hypothetical protein HKN47_17585 [Pirellulaceae bacterium]|nr:hypothetical protein [Pirellulaceae bacterium]